MSRAAHNKRLKAASRWPALRRLLSTHFGEHFWMQYSSFDAARTASSEELDHRDQKQLLREWRDWNNSEGVVDDIRIPLAYLGVEPPFDTALAARHFMNDLYDALIIRVRRKEPTWKP